MLLDDGRVDGGVVRAAARQGGRLSLRLAAVGAGLFALIVLGSVAYNFLVFRNVPDLLYRILLREMALFLVPHFLITLTVAYFFGQHAGVKVLVGGRRAARWGIGTALTALAAGIVGGMIVALIGGFLVANVGAYGTPPTERIALTALGLFLVAALPAIGLGVLLGKKMARAGENFPGAGR